MLRLRFLENGALPTAYLNESRRCHHPSRDLVPVVRNSGSRTLTFRAEFACIRCGGPHPQLTLPLTLHSPGTMRDGFAGCAFRTNAEPLSAVEARADALTVKRGANATRPCCDFRLGAESLCSPGNPRF